MIFSFVSILATNKAKAGTNEKIVCATSHRRILGNKYFKNSNNCQVRVSLDTRKFDDGFNMKEERVANVVLRARRN